MEEVMWARYDGCGQVGVQGLVVALAARRPVSEPSSEPSNRSGSDTCGTSK
jgi:hypothetical protein